MKVKMFRNSYEKWKTDLFFDENIRSELNTLDIERNFKEIEDKFYRDLEFSTGGLRGIMGAGTNRMNKYTVCKATKGLGNYLLDKFGQELCVVRGVAVAYDTRNNSEYFAQITADVLSGMGIKVYLYDVARLIP